MEEKLTYEKLKQTISDIFYKNVKLSKELEDIGQCGDSNLYYLGSGCYTNKAGWKEFKKELKKQANGEKS